MRNVKIRNTLQMTSLLFGVVMLFCYISWCLGYEGFILIGDISIPDWLNVTIGSILYCTNWSLLFCFVLNTYSWKILRITMPLTMISGIGSQFIPGIIFSGPIPTMILMSILIIRKMDKLSWMRLGIITVVPILFQWITSQFSVIDLSVNVSVYQAFRLSINNILLNLLLFSIGGAQYNVGSLEQLVFPGRVHNDQDRNESCQVTPASPGDVPLNKMERWVMRSVIAVVQVLQWIFILWVCNLDNLFLDALVITTSFICHGMIISKRRHMKSIILCTLAATITFYLAARFTISFQYSQFFPIVVGLMLVYTMYRIDYQIEKMAEERLRQELKQIQALKSDVDSIWNTLDQF